jgi:hypothetical protein
MEGLMIVTIAQPDRAVLARLQTDAKVTGNGQLVIESKDGRTFLLAGDVVRCHADAAEFTDDDGEDVVLPYAQIASAGIGFD